MAGERQAAWTAGRLEHPPAGAAEAPPDEAVFRNIREIERDWMPAIRALVEAQRRAGTAVHCLDSLAAVDAFDVFGRGDEADG